MNNVGWNQTGFRMVESFRKHWPSDIELLVYAEDFDIPYYMKATKRKLPSWLFDFKRRHHGNRRANGQMATRYDYVFDAVKFSHKVAAVTDAGLAQSDGIMIWLDADTFTHSTVTHEWLNGLFPEPSYIAWLDRMHSYPEGGFVMYRCGHRSHRAFMEDFRGLYTGDTILKLEQTHDCWAMQHVARERVASGDIEPPVSLSGEGRRVGHVLANSPLSVCIDHMKGPRKTVGRTPKNERTLIRDSHPYWA